MSSVVYTGIPGKPYKGYIDLTVGRTYKVINYSFGDILLKNDKGHYKSYSICNSYGLSLFTELYKYRNETIDYILS